HAATAHNALGRVVAEVRVGVILFVAEEIGTVIAVAHRPHPHHTGDVLQLAVAVGRTGQAFQRMVGQVEFHHAAAQVAQLFGFGAHHHARFHRGGAGSRVAAAPVDLHQTQATGAVGLQAVAGTELGDIDPGLGGGTHHGGAF